MSEMLLIYFGGNPPIYIEMLTTTTLSYLDPTNTQEKVQKLSIPNTYFFVLTLVSD